MQKLEYYSLLPRIDQEIVETRGFLRGTLLLSDHSSAIFGGIKSRKVTTIRMPIVRLREVNCNHDKQRGDIEPKRNRRQHTRVHLLAAIADLRHRSSIKMVKDSTNLIQQSRQLIFETELGFIKTD